MLTILHSKNNAFININNTDIRRAHANLCSLELGHQIYQSETLSGTIFAVGKTNFSAVHSQPSYLSERIFFSFSGIIPKYFEMLEKTL